MLHFQKIKKGTKEYIKKFRAKKITNIIISSLIFILGVSAIASIVIFEEGGNVLRAYRYMTVNGTTFTSILAFVFVFLNIREIKSGKSFKSDVLYYLRLIAMVSECVIAVVTLVGLLPIIPDSPDIFNYDSFLMHIVIPLLSISSFALNDPPRRKINYAKLLHGAWGILAYSSVIIPLICTNVIAKSDIPYSFLDFNKQPVWYLACFAIMVFSMSYAFSFGLAKLNRYVSPAWFIKPRKKKQRTFK